MSDGTVWVSIAEAARRQGVTRTAIRNRIKRGTIKHRVNNQGNPLVEAPEERGEPFQRGTATGTSMEVPGHAPATVPETVPVTEPSGLDRTERRHLAEIDRLQKSHAAHIAALESQLNHERKTHHAEVSRLMATMQERVDAAEMRAERAEDQAITALTQAADAAERITKSLIEAVSKPVWRRLLS